MRLDETTVLSFLIRRFRYTLLIAALTSVVSGVCSVLLVTRINAALTSDRSDSFYLAVTFAAAAILAMLGSMVSNILFERLRQRCSAELRHYISLRAMQAPLRQLEEIGSAKVQSALSEHATSVAHFFFTVPAILTNGVIVLGCLSYLVILSPRIFLITLPFIALGSVGYHLVHLRAIKHLRAGAVEQDRLFEHFRSLTEGAKELRLHARKRQVFRDEVLHRSIDAVSRQRIAGMSLFVAASSWGNFLIYAFLGLVLFGFPGDMPGRAAVLTGFALVIVYMVSPLQSLLLSIPDTNLAAVAADRIKRLLVKLQSSEHSADDESAAAFRGLTLSGVQHRYYHEQSNEMFELGPIDLRLNPGEIVFLVGGNGSGKTTVAKLLAGLYVPETGGIRLNEECIGEHNRDQYRQQFSAIFSDFHLFDSLLDQRHGELDARGNRLLERLQLQHKVQLRDGAFTVRELSQGQRKRLALVVACLEDRPVLLFDEWAADQDPAFKEVFYYEILRELRDLGKAIVVISHDDRYFHVANRIIRMEHGKIMTRQAPRALEEAGQ